MSYIYKAEVVRVIDGDTVRFKLTKEFDIGFYITQTATYEGNFRLLGINTPEIRGEERPEGLKAKEAVQNLLKKADHIMVETFKPDKYGRWLAKIFVAEDGEEFYCLNDYLVEQGIAELYMV